jgi:hypothetical protein
MFGTLDALFTNQVSETYGNACGTYPAGDVDRLAGASAFHGGFIDIPNIARSQKWSGGVMGASDIERGLVGVLVQQASATGVKTGDATRLWGDCSYGNDGAGGTAGDITAPFANGSNSCRPSYSRVDSVSHGDLLP